MNVVDSASWLSYRHMNGPTGITSPLFVSTWTSPDPELRAWAVRGLAMSGRGESSQVSMLIESLADPDPWVSTVASNWLHEIAPQTLANTPACQPRTPAMAAASPIPP